MLALLLLNPESPSFVRVYVNWILYSLECEDIIYHRFTSSFSNRLGFKASTRIRIRCVFKRIYSRERFEKYTVH